MPNDYSILVIGSENITKGRMIKLPLSLATTISTLNCLQHLVAVLLTCRMHMSQSEIYV